MQEKTGLTWCNHVAHKDLALLNQTKEQNQTSLPWIEKYRPQCLTDVVSQHETIETIRKWLTCGDMPHVLFYGPPGTGKTSTILAMAKEMYGSNYKKMILELNASDQRGIDVVREDIKTFATSKLLFASAQHKLIILDEADSMTSGAQMALRRVLELYSKNTRFCFIANLSDKIIPALHSRCMRFKFTPLESKQVVHRLTDVGKSEGVKMDEGGCGLQAIVALSDGDMRKALNTLQACHVSFGSVTEANVYSCLGQPSPKEVDNIYTLLTEKPFSEALIGLRQLLQEGGYTTQVLLSKLFQKMMASARSLQIPELQMIKLTIKMAEIE